MEIAHAEVAKVNPVNGRFLKGHKPFNKGLKQKDWMDGRKIKKVLSKLQRNGNPDIGGSNAIRIIGVKNGKFYPFSSSEDAYRKTNICARNIRSCCHGKRNKAGGVQWFFEDDPKWTKLINPPN